MTSYQDYFQQTEDRDGFRLTWNVLPASKTEASKLVVPLTVLFTPLKDRPGWCDIRKVCNLCCSSIDFRSPAYSLWACCLRSSLLPCHFEPYLSGGFQGKTMDLLYLLQPEYFSTSILCHLGHESGLSFWLRRREKSSQLLKEACENNLTTREEE